MSSTDAVALLRAWDLTHQNDATAGEWARILTDFPLFAEVARRRLRKLVRNATFAEFRTGETVVGSGDADDWLYIVLEGAAKTIGGPAPRSMTVGDYFGELSLVGERSPYGMVVATLPLYVMRLPRRSVVRLARKHPAVTLTLLRDLAGRFPGAERSVAARIIAVPECSGTGT